MKHLSIKTVLGRSLVVAALLALAASPASAATYTLRAGTTMANYGDGPIIAWGYALDSSDVSGVVADGIIRVPGPTLYVPPGEGLTINLVNELNEATSIVIHGQKRVGTPVFDGGRVRSFTNEASQFAAAPANVWFYSWTAAELKPGTFLYNSGSHPSKQVHMGLYGAVVVDAPDSDNDPTTYEAYPGVFYDQDIVVIYSDVDPAIRSTESATQPLNFKPKYFLVNGDHTGNSVLTSAPADLNSRVLLRIVNAGLKNYVPTMLGEDLEWIAEDGNTYPYSRKSYSAFLGAGKTMDALWVPVTTDRHTLYDRRLHTSINGEAGGGLRAFLDSGNTNVPVANAGADVLHAALGTPITLTGSATAGSGTYTTWDWSLVAFPAGSSAALVPNADPAIVSITPDVAGTYSVQLVATDNAGVSSAPATVNVFTNLPPVAVILADAAANQNDTVDLDGSDSYDPDADLITGHSWLVTAPSGSQASLSGALTSFDALETGTYSVELTVSDGELTGSDILFVVSSVAVNQPPTATNDFFQVIWKTSNNVLYPLANDSDADGTIVPSSLTIVTNPMNGASAVPTAVGTILYTPKNGFKGTDFFTYSICDNLDECSEAEVLVNVVK